MWREAISLSWTNGVGIPIWILLILLILTLVTLDEWRMGDECDFDTETISTDRDEWQMGDDDSENAWTDTDWDGTDTDWAMSEDSESESEPSDSEEDIDVLKQKLIELKEAKEKARDDLIHLENEEYYNNRMAEKYEQEMLHWKRKLEKSENTESD